MKKLFSVLLTIVLAHLCNAQISLKKEIYSKIFDWTITIPEDFEVVDSTETRKMYSRGKKIIENTQNIKIQNKPKTVFIFKSDQWNYFTAQYQFFDVKVDKSSVKNSFESLKKTAYHSFKDKYTKISIDTISSIQIVDELQFQKFEMKIYLPNDKILVWLMFNRLFDNKLLSLNIIYLNEQKGKQMLETWRNSKFGNK